MRLLLFIAALIAGIGCGPELDEEPRCRLTTEGWLCDEGSLPPDPDDAGVSVDDAALDAAEGDAGGGEVDMGPDAGDEPPPTAASCADHLIMGDSGRGVRTIEIDGNELDVFCDQETVGGGWMLVARSVSGADGNFGWTVSRGALDDDATPYSLALEAFPVRELLIGNRGDGKAWGNRIYHVDLPDDFWVACTDGCETTITNETGMCNDPTMLGWTGRHGRTDTYWFRDLADAAPYGLFPGGWQLFYDDCRGGEMNMSQGMIFVR